MIIILCLHSLHVEDLLSLMVHNNENRTKDCSEMLFLPKKITLTCSICESILLSLVDISIHPVDRVLSDVFYPGFFSIELVSLPISSTTLCGFGVRYTSNLEVQIKDYLIMHLLLFQSRDVYHCLWSLIPKVSSHFSAWWSLSSEDFFTSLVVQARCLPLSLLGKKPCTELIL